MEKVGKFKKIDKDKFIDQKAYDSIQLPKRATIGSAGYDFFAPYDFTIEPKSSFTVHSGIKCKIKGGWVLMVHGRSSLGIKGLRLNTTVGIIDSDYYSNPQNDGEIGIGLVNTTDKRFEFKAGDRLAQGIFVPYGITTDDDVTDTRVGGFGSTGK